MGCRVASGWSTARAHSGHVAQPEASGENSLGTRVHSAFGLPGGIRESRDTWRLGGLPEEGFSLGTRRQMANSGDIRGKSSRCGVFGDISRFRRSLSAQPSGHVARSEGRTEGFGSKACRKGLSEKWFPGQVAISEGRSGRGFGRVFERRPSAGLREDFERLRRRVFERFPRGASGPVFEGGFRRELRRVAFRADYHR